MTKFEFCLVSCMEKVLPHRRPSLLQEKKLQGFCGETLTVQAAYTCANDDFGESDCRFAAKIYTDAETQIHVRHVALVPCAYPCHGTWDEDYLVTKPGMYPDLLLPAEMGKPVKAIAAQWRSLWIDVEAQPGTHSVTLEFSDLSGQLLQQLSFTVEVLHERLPEQRLIHTQWFHADCLADYYSVPVFSEEHWRIIDNFMGSAARHGINMMLTPVFTPPLDTAKGGERTTVQLVGVNLSNGKYTFDFSRLERWLSLCGKNGIRYLEISHLFTQWGAEFAPKIMVHAAGVEKRLFGWDTPAVGGAYTQFLRKFIPALKHYLASAGWLERTWFHISDEPHEQEAKTFAAAKASVFKLLQDCKVMDALSSYEIYQQGLVERPVVSVDQMEPFLKADVPHLWAYYCTVQALDVPNRFISMPSSRNRILGMLLYYFDIEGYLHWGFNFYNTQHSTMHIDPYLVTDAGEAFPSGDPFLVYPAPDGSAYESVRGAVLQKALCDLGALQLLEQKIGRAGVVKMLEELAHGAISFRSYPRSMDFFDQMRAEIYRRLRPFLRSRLPEV